MIIVTVQHINGECDVYEFDSMIKAGAHLSQKNYEFRKIVKVFVCSEVRDGDAVKAEFEARRAELIDSIKNKLTEEELELVNL